MALVDVANSRIIFLLLLDCRMPLAGERKQAMLCIRYHVAVANPGKILHCEKDIVTVSFERTGLTSKEFCILVIPVLLGPT